MKLLKTVIHIHTDASYDSNTTPAALVETARRQGVDCIAVTDHDEICGALAARDIGGVRVIVGEEISTAGGHLIGLFLRERIEPGLPVVETAQRIRAQGGLVLAPHPYASLCDNSLHDEALAEVAPFLDAVEVCNAQNLFFWEERRAQAFCTARGLTPYVGADAHIRGYLDGAWQAIPDFDSPATFRTALRQAVLHRGHFGPGYFAHMGWRHVWDKVVRTRLPGYGTRHAELDAARTAS